MEKPRRMPRYISWPLRALLGLFVLMVLAFGGAMLWLQTSGAQALLQRVAVEALTENTGYKVELRGLRVGLPLTVRADSLALGDADGVWLEASQVGITILPGWDMQERLNVVDASIAQLSLLRAPLSEAEAPPPAPDAPGAGPDVTLHMLKVEKLTLAPAITGLPAALEASLEGELKWLAKPQELRFTLASRAKPAVPEWPHEAKLTLAGGLAVARNLLALDEVKLASGPAAVSARAELDLTQQTLRAGVSAALNLQGVRPELAGEAKLQLEASGPFAAPGLKGDMTLADTSYKGHAVPDTSWQIVAQPGDEGRWVGRLHARMEQESLTLGTEFLWRQPELRLTAFEMKAPGAAMHADMALDTNTMLADGKITAGLDELSRLAAMFGQQVKGSAKLDATLSAAEGKQAASAKAELKSLHTPYGNAGAVNAAFELRDAYAMQPDAATISVAHARAAGAHIDMLTLAVKHAGKGWSFDASARGSQSGAPFQLAAKGEGTWQDQTAHLVLGSLAGSYDGYTLTAAAPVTLGYKAGKTSWDAPRLALKGGRLALKGWLEGERVSLDASAAGLPLALKPGMVPPQLERAALDGTAALGGTLAAPQIKADIKVNNLYPMGKKNPATLALNAAYAQQRLQLKAAASHKRAGRGALDVALPLALALSPYRFELPQEGEMRGTLDLDMTLGGLASLFLPRGHVLNGTLAGRLELGGSIASPSLGGSLALREADYAWPEFGMRLRAMTATLRAQGKRVLLEHFTASDEAGGTLAANAEMDLGAPAMPFRGALSTPGFALLSHRNVHGAVKADIKLEGDKAGAQVTGTVTSDKVEIDLPEQMPADMPQLNVVRSLPQEESKAAPQQAAAALYPVALDVAISLPGQVFVRGRGVTAELDGTLKIAGMADKPQIQGTLATKRGRFEEFGKQFDLKEVTLTFEGDIPPSPYLTVIASAKAGDTEVMPTLTGPVLEPKLTIESNPSLPQEEALSLLLFGKDSRSISALQAVQLADSLRRLSGKGGGSLNPLERARALLGVDDLTVDEGEGGAENARFGVGKYLREGVYVGLERGTQAGTGSARIEVEMTPDISLESSTGEEGQSSVGLNWKHDY